MTTALEARRLSLLSTELAIAQGAYATRRADADHMALKRAATRARLLHRRFWHAALAKACPGFYR